MTVRWPLQARARLAEIREVIAQDDPASADRHVRRLIDRTDLTRGFADR